MSYVKMITFLSGSVLFGGLVGACSDIADDMSKQACEKKADLILLDWVLPSLTGLEICQNLRRKGIGAAPRPKERYCSRKLSESRTSRRLSCSAH